MTLPKTEHGHPRLADGVRHGSNVGIQAFSGLFFLTFLHWFLHWNLRGGEYLEFYRSSGTVSDHGRVIPELAVEPVTQ